MKHFFCIVQGGVEFYSFQMEQRKLRSPNSTIHLSIPEPDLVGPTLTLKCDFSFHSTTNYPQRLGPHKDESQSMTTHKICQTNPSPTIKQEVVVLQNIDKTTWQDDIMANKCYLILDAQNSARVIIRMVDFFLHKIDGHPSTIVETSVTNSEQLA